MLYLLIFYQNHMQDVYTSMHIILFFSVGQKEMLKTFYSLFFHLSSITFFCHIRLHVICSIFLFKLFK